MARARGSGTMGPTRSVRLPRALEAWFSQRLDQHRERSPSELLVALVHGGLRLREGYMAIHRHALERLLHDDKTPQAYDVYLRCLHDTFGPDYVAHLDRWLVSDGVKVADGHE